MDLELKEECHNYWNHRAAGYSEVNWDELKGVQRKNWANLLNREIQQSFPDRKREEINVIDIGAGPGFLSIVLAENGYSVTGIDYSEDMLEFAKQNMKKCGTDVDFCKGDAQNLEFEDSSFDVVISRNLTWNLQDVETVYIEWIRVLKPNGLLLVFDANWYHYLNDEKCKNAYLLDRKKVSEKGFEDYNVGDNFDKMEEIASRLPMTTHSRPDWDANVLENLNVIAVDTIENVGDLVYSEKEKVNYASTPLFMIKAMKG